MTGGEHYDIINDMSNEKLLEVKKYLDADRFVRLAGIRIVGLDDGCATVSADIGPEHLNAGGAVQGGMLYTLSDFAFAVLTNAYHPMTVTQSSTITYIRAARTDRVTATAREIVRAGHNCVVEVVVKDADGEIVCTGSFNGFISGKKE